VVTSRKPSLTFKNSTLFPYGVFYVFYYVFQNKRRLLPYATVTDLFFITETEWVYYAVRAGSLNEKSHFFLKLSFHQYFIFISVYMLLLPERQTGEAWELFKQAGLFSKSGKAG